MVRQLEKKSGELKTENNTKDVSLAHYIDPVEETQGDVRSAYQNYVAAQKDLLSAFKEQEQLGKNARKINEKRYRAYEEIIEQAFKNREKADYEALELYSRTVEKAALVYRSTIKQTLQVCQHTTDEAWRTSINVRKPAPQVFISKFKIGLNSLAVFLSRTFRRAKVKISSVFQRIVRFVKDYRVVRSNSPTH